MLSLLFSILTFAQANIPVDHIVAVINNEIVLESDFSKLENKISKDGMVDEILLGDSSPDVLKKNRKEQLEYLIKEKILSSEIKRLNLSVTNERVDQEMRKIAKERGITKAELLALTKEHGLSPGDYQDFLKSMIERQSLIEQEVSSKIRISDEDISARYSQNNKDISSTVFEYSVAHIYFNPNKNGADSAVERARMALKKLTDGESFDSVAEQHSEDPNFSSGGFLGNFKAGEFSKDLEDPIKILNPGEFTGVVKSKSGIHILKLNSKKIITDPRFEKEKEKIRAILFQEAFKKAIKNWLITKREDAFIRLN